MSAKKDGTYTIQGVVTLLQGEFPITASNLRYWEKQGLLQPERTEGGHRVYDDEDVARIRLIKSLQSKRVYSIDAIRRYMQSGLSTEEIARHLAGNEWLYRSLSYTSDFVPVDLGTLLDRTGLSARAVSDMEERGLLGPINPEDTVRLYDEDGLRLAEMIGWFGRLGLAPESLEPLRDMAAELARRHLTLFVTQLATLSRSPDADRLMPEAERFIHLLYHFQLKKVAEQLASEGFFGALHAQTTRPDTPAGTHPQGRTR